MCGCWGLHPSAQLLPANLLQAVVGETHTADNISAPPEVAPKRPPWQMRLGGYRLKPDCLPCKSSRLLPRLSDISKIYRRNRFTRNSRCLRGKYTIQSNAQQRAMLNERGLIWHGSGWLVQYASHQTLRRTYRRSLPVSVERGSYLSPARSQRVAFSKELDQSFQHVCQKLHGEWTLHLGTDGHYDHL